MALARWNSPALRRGELLTLDVSETTWVYARNLPGIDVAIVALHKQAAMDTVTVTVPVALSLNPGTVLEDQLSGQTVTIGSNSEIQLNLEAFGAMILVPM